MRIFIGQEFFHIYLIFEMLVCCLHSYYDFGLILPNRQADIVAIISWPMSLTPAVNYKLSLVIVLQPVSLLPEKNSSTVSMTPAINLSPVATTPGNLSPVSLKLVNILLVSDSL